MPGGVAESLWCAARACCGAACGDEAGAQLELDGAQLELGGAQLELGGAQLELGGAQLEVGGVELDLGGELEFGGDQLELGGAQQEVGVATFGMWVQFPRKCALKIKCLKCLWNSSEKVGCCWRSLEVPLSGEVAS
ncbi:MAG: hypothetical protein DHS20C12_30320 [Pseudohongiella sp.]|uniref:hypothetical protein n=1 Tax=Nitrosomonas sp. TaxID=42353 RepID=UPI00207F4062|nr:hypothetical protein [Nitrosomonas sp.]GJL77005.1 MAG: hypothetical protein NMNS02_31110 [Nitrosomonas sp.]GJM14629.1 MAG: hypothetical protein DHS20C12_30320 [Pseudohongiella sp.]